LARIELTAAELNRLAGQLDVILDAVAAVSAAAGDDVPPTSHPLPLVNVFRIDAVNESLPQAAVLAMAPAQEEGRFRVPHILEEEAA
jgi:aspartyl-tRNA(Asn)/glutamyl-tRNA(Gln) amidotransferase subunit C